MKSFHYMPIEKLGKIRFYKLSPVEINFRKQVMLLSESAGALIICSMEEVLRIVNNDVKTFVKFYNNEPVEISFSRRLMITTVIQKPFRPLSNVIKGSTLEEFANTISRKFDRGSVWQKQQVIELAESLGISVGKLVEIK